MKINLNEFRVTSSIARQLAESSWGRGGTSTSPCKTTGVYSFSCSSHGGYVVEPSALTDEQKAEIAKHDRRGSMLVNLALLVQHQPVGEDGFADVVISISYPYSRPKSRKYHPALGDVRWVEYPVYIFEEDCAWAVLEHCTGIMDDYHAAKDREEHLDYVKRIVDRWHPLAA